jgi:UDP-N-acetylglucosamine 4-epimerase
MALLNNKPVYINGDGETTRDFCFIENVVQANILSAMASESARNEVYNIAVGDRTSLNELVTYIHNALLSKSPDRGKPDVIYRDFREGDVRHSQADISKAKAKLGYLPSHDVSKGLEMAMDWYIESNRNSQS